MTLYEVRNQEPYRSEWTPDQINGLEKLLDRALLSAFGDIQALGDPELVEKVKVNFEQIRKKFKATES